MSMEEADGNGDHLEMGGSYKPHPQNRIFEKRSEGREAVSPDPPPTPTAWLTPHLCNCRHRGPVRSPRCRRSGTFQAGSRSSRTHRGSREDTRPHLQGPQVSPPRLAACSCCARLPRPGSRRPHPGRHGGPLWG